MALRFAGAAASIPRRCHRGVSPFIRASMSSRALSSEPAQEEKPSQRKKLQELFTKYGKLALGTHVALSLCSLSAFYAAVSTGVDVSAALERVGLSVSSTSEATSTFAVAYIAHKATAPVRIPITLAVVPPLARLLEKK